ncbi:hypothetical protein ARTHROSP310_30490 [Arthrobacter sp. AD-310]
MEGDLLAVLVQDHHVVAAVLDVGGQDELHGVVGGGEDPAEPVAVLVEVDVVPLPVVERSAGSGAGTPPPLRQESFRSPYVGKYIKDLSFDRVRSLDCGSQTLANYPGQQASLVPRCLEHRVSIQSFDRGALRLVEERGLCLTFGWRSGLRGSN